MHRHTERLKKTLKTFKKVTGPLLVLIAALLSWTPAEASRIKDVASIEGVRENQLIGYGLISGLRTTGDSVVGAPFTIQSLISMMNRMGVNLTLDPKQITAKNVAAVIVTARLPPFAKPGSLIDVVVSSIGDAKSLQGGTLLMTPLKAPDGQIYAVAQGPVTLGGYIGGKAGDTTTKNHTNVGRVPNGAMVEREVKTDLATWESISVVLHQPDFTTALRLSEAVDHVFGKETAQPLSAGVVRVNVPRDYQGRMVQYLAAVESLDVEVDQRARVIVNERTGTVVMGGHVRISTVAVAHGNLTIQVKTKLDVSQPGAPLIGNAAGQTVVTPEVETTVKEDPARFMLLEQSVTLSDVVRGLNSVGITPRDIVAILQALKAAGALQADLEII
ncbi:MAG TPA: flagellar basal body P-ring protein FlgI [Nitrospirales bacterium]|jgi:flagellar P-ring protein precursor FlgI